MSYVRLPGERTDPNERFYIQKCHWYCKQCGWSNNKHVPHEKWDCKCCHATGPSWSEREFLRLPEAKKFHAPAPKVKSIDAAVEMAEQILDQNVKWVTGIKIGGINEHCHSPSYTVDVMYSIARLLRPLK